MTIVALLALGIAKFLAPISTILEITAVQVRDLPQIGRAARHNLGLSLLEAAKHIPSRRER